jgi:hypothetical protein
LLARRLLPLSIALLIGCFLGVVIGLPTCDTETGTCPTWHEWLNAVAFFGTGVFLVSSLVLVVIVAVTPPYRKSRKRKLG